MKLEDITQEEWDQYQWVEINMPGVGIVYLRGVKRTQPPDDGYRYAEATQFGDREQKWKRAKRYID